MATTLRKMAINEPGRHVVGRTAWVGSLRGPGAVLGAISELVARGDA